MKWLGLSAIILTLAVPAVVSAEFFSRTTNLIIGVKSVIDLLIPIVAGLALLYFFWGLAKFILHADNEDKREEGKQVMKWGIVALFVMVSIWGIVRFITGELLPGVSLEPIPFNLYEFESIGPGEPILNDVDPFSCPNGDCRT